MKFWYTLTCIIALIILFPYIRCFFKRVICMVKIKKLCRNIGYKMQVTHPFWFLGSKHSKKCDLYIETASEVFSIKLFGVPRRFSILVFKENGEYFIKNYIAFISYGSRILLPFNSKPKPITTYNFRYQYKNEWESKSQRNILLVNPVSMELRHQPHHGGETIVNAGDIINGMEIYSLPQFLGALEKAL